MKAKLTFSKAELEQLVKDKASKGGFVATSEVYWDNERDEVSVDVRPMSPEERLELDLQNRPIEEVVLESLRAAMDDLVMALRTEHEQTRDAVDQSVMEWLEPFRSQTGKILQIAQEIQRGGPVMPAKPPSQVLQALRTEIEEAGIDLEALSEADEDEPEDEYAAARRARFARVKQEIESEGHVDHVTIKGESSEFPKDKRIT